MSQTARACPSCNTSLPSNAAFCYACGTATPAGIDRVTGEFVAPASGAGTESMEALLGRLRKALAPHYELGERIGVGGFAEVYGAKDVRLKREVAVKVTRPDFAVDRQMMARFRREAETIAALRHPHIMPIYAGGEAAGLAYIVRPFVRGEALKARLDRERRLPVDEARRIVLQTADALASAHEAGVVHRDVKPDNIMLDRREDHVLLMDFGIAKAVDTGGEVSALTSTGLVMGTPHYMSPEQAAGERTVDARADQYALAVIAYRMLAGALPFDGPTVRAILSKQLVGAAIPLAEAAPEAPRALVAAVERAMSKEPDDRFPSVREFVRALRTDPTYAAEVLRSTGSGGPYTPIVGAPAVAAPAVAAQVDGRPRRRAPLVVGALAALGIAGAAAAYVSSDATPTAPALRVDSTLSARVIERAAPRAEAPDGAASGAAGATAPAAVAAAPDSARPPGDSARADSVARRLAADSALVRRAGYTFGTPAADSFLVYMARSRRRSCERTFAAGRDAETAKICGAEARLGRPAAQRVLGALAEKGGRFDSAAVWYERASGRDAQSAVRLARLLDEGKGVRADVARATSLLTERATAGSVEAQRALAERLARGLPGLAKDERAAATWYERAGAAGDVPSMVAYGLMLKDGRGVRKNEREAAQWFTLAADKGDAEGQYRLGMAHLGGRGVADSDSLALVWLRKAAAQGHPGGRFEVDKRTPKR
jgi:serine/threonine-protein kinase